MRHEPWTIPIIKLEMKYYLSLLLAFHTLDNALSAKSWKGDLPNEVYGPGGCDDDTAIIMNGTVTEVHALSNGLLCETDVFGNITIYTKFKIDQCGTDNDPENMYITMYNCDTSTCESCDENPELIGYASKDLFEIKSLTENVDHCFGWHTTLYDNQTSVSILDEVGQTELAYQKFIPPSTIEDSSGYWGVWLANTCMGDFLGWEGADEHSDEHSEDGHDHDDDKEVSTESVLDPETTKNRAFNVGHKASAVIILLIGAALVL